MILSSIGFIGLETKI